MVSLLLSFFFLFLFFSRMGEGEFGRKRHGEGETSELETGKGVESFGFSREFRYSLMIWPCEDTAIHRKVCLQFLSRGLASMSTAPDWLSHFFLFFSASLFETISYDELVRCGRSFLRGI